MSDDVRARILKAARMAAEHGRPAGDLGTWRRLPDGQIELDVNGHVRIMSEDDFIDFFERHGLELAVIRRPR